MGRVTRTRVPSPGFPLIMSSRHWVCQRYDWEHTLEKFQYLFGGAQPELKAIA